MAGRVFKIKKSHFPGFHVQEPQCTSITQQSSPALGALSEAGLDHIDRQPIKLPIHLRTMHKLPKCNTVTSG